MERERQRQVQRDVAERGVERSVGKPERNEVVREPAAEKPIRERDKGMER